MFGLCVAEQYGACLPAADLARLCATCSASRLAAPKFAKAALGRHGLTSGSLALLCQLEQIPERTTVDLKRAGARKVIAGSRLCSVLVGSLSHLRTLAQCPPERGDEWTFQVMLRRGMYNFDVRGWRNPAHGVLDLFIDGAQVAALDFLGSRTVRHRYRVVVEVACSGPHTVVGRTCRSNAEPTRSTRYWVCLSSLSFAKTCLRGSPAPQKSRTVIAAGWAARCVWRNASVILFDNDQWRGERYASRL